MAGTTIGHEEAHDCNKIVKKGESVGPACYWPVRSRKRKKVVCVEETRWARRVVHLTVHLSVFTPPSPNNNHVHRFVRQDIVRGQYPGRQHC